MTPNTTSRAARARARAARVLRLLLPPLAFYLLIVLLLFCCQRRLMYHPVPAGRESALLADETALDVAGPAGPVEAWLQRADLLEERPLVWVSGGNAENAALTRLEFRGRGWPVLSWSYPGYGGSAGAPGEEAIIAAGRALIEEIDRRFDKPRIVLFGRSLGSAVAVALARERDPLGLVLVSPQDSIAEVAARLYPFLPVRRLIKDPWDSAARARGIRRPALMLVAERDRVIPPERSETLARVWPGPVELRVLTGVGHNDIHHHPEYWPAVGGFIDSLAGIDDETPRSRATR